MSERLSPAHDGSDGLDHRGRGPRMHRAARVGAAFAAGLAMLFAFPPFDIWIFAVLAPAALALVVRNQPLTWAGLYGFAGGVGFFVPLLYWTGLEVGPIPWLALSLVQALFFVLLGVGLALVQRLPGWPVWAAAVWVAVEAIRGRVPYGGLTWGKLAFAQADGPFVGLAALGGTPLVSFAVALAGSALAAVVVAVTVRRRLIAGTTAVVVTLSGLFVSPPPADGPTITVASVQGNAPELGLDFNSRARAVTNNHVDVTERLAADVEAGVIRQPDLVVWPENAPDRNPFRDQRTYEAVERAVNAIGVPVLVSAILPTADEQNVENTSILWHPETGPGETYVKRHPMPFGEYIPMRRLARMITDAVDRQPRDHLAGDDAGVFDSGAATVGVAICFEVGFDGIVRDAVAEGGQILVVQTNNAGFGDTPMTEQHLAQSRLRAVEHGRTTIVAALSGVSAIVGPDGEVRQRAELFTQDLLVDDVQLSDARTLATTVGAWPEAVISFLALGAAGFAAYRARRSGAVRQERRVSRETVPAALP